MCLCPGYVDTELTRHGGSKTLDKAYFEETKVIYEAIGWESIFQEHYVTFYYFPKMLIFPLKKYHKKWDIIFYAFIEFPCKLQESVL